jgi:hypothetical protein
MGFSVMFWNVENFGSLMEGQNPNSQAFQQRVESVYNHINGLQPDLFGLCEIKDKVALRNLLMIRLDGYSFGITDGVEGIEIMAGWKVDTFDQVIFTQRREFKAGSEYLRPGSLASVKYNNEFYNFLFLHTDSGKHNRDYSNWQDMFEKIWSLKDKLDEITDGLDTAKFVAMGDMNTMGRIQSGDYNAVSGDQEVQDLGRDAHNNGMTLLEKNYDTSWRKGPSNPNFESNLDHAVATTNNMNFKTFDIQNAVRQAPVRVDGWHQLAGQAKDDFTMYISDHCSIYIEID